MKTKLMLFTLLGLMILCPIGAIGFHELPYEVIANVAQRSSLEDVSSLRQTCKAIRYATADVHRKKIVERQENDIIQLIENIFQKLEFFPSTNSYFETLLWALDKCRSNESVEKVRILLEQYDFLRFIDKLLAERRF